MAEIEKIKQKIEKLYKTNPKIHIDVYASRSKLAAAHVPAEIVAVYSNIFQVKENTIGRECVHTHMYSDLITGSVSISELDPFK